MSAPAFTLRLQFDGGSRGNPGPSYYSFEVTSANGFRLDAREVPLDGRLTCNEAEYEGLLAALQATLASWIMPATTHIAIWSDSMLVVQQVRGAWRCKKPHLKALRERVMALLRQFQGFEISWVGRQSNVNLFGH